MKHRRAHPDLSKGQVPRSQPIRPGYDLLPTTQPMQFQTRATLDELWKDNEDDRPVFWFEKQRI